MKKLGGQELYRRLQEARNLKKLNLALHQQLETRDRQIEELMVLTKTQAERIKVLEKLVETQGLLIEELQRSVFRKKKKNKDQNDDENKPPKKPRKPREKANFQRPIPADVTETNSYPIDQCQICKTTLTNKKTVERFLEDIVLPDETKNPWKKIEKKLIETGWCTKCRKFRSCEPIAGAKVQLGPNVRAMVVYSTVIQRQTYSQVVNFFKDVAHIKISDGEIVEILAEQAVRAGPEYQRIEQRISEQKGVHADETTWKTVAGAEGDYGWGKTGTETPDTIYQLGKSRGKGNAQTIISKKHPEQVLISDDYAAYDNVAVYHELCWAHPNRKLRDLSESKTLSGEAKAACTETFLAFQKLYADCEEIRKKAVPFEEKKKQKPKLMARFLAIAQPADADPKKLETIKKTLIEKKENYFVWIEKEGIVLDNNRAERILRPLVLKRKISFGSKTDRGAKNLGILFSVAMSLWWKHPPNFFSAYADLLA